MTEQNKRIKALELAVEIVAPTKTIQSDDPIHYTDIWLNEWQDYFYKRLTEIEEKEKNGLPNVSN